MRAREAEHVCDDTAYPAAATPGECTCSSEDELERRMARIRIFGSDEEATR
jgi:hypothetical protein